MRFIPSWLPGAGFKRKSEQWAKRTVTHRQEPFDYVLKNLVGNLYLKMVDALCWRSI